MPRCPLCGSAHIVVTVRPSRRGQCFRCDLEWGLDGPSTPESTSSTVDGASGQSSP
jgi:hypothetical protein